MTMITAPLKFILTMLLGAMIALNVTFVYLSYTDSQALDALMCGIATSNPLEELGCRVQSNN